MIANCYQISDEPQLIPLAANEIVPACKDSGTTTWLDLQSDDDKEMKAWLNKVGAGDLARRLSLESRDRSGFYPLKNEIFLSIPVLTDSEGTRVVEHIALLCKENLLITLHRKAIFTPRQIADLQEAESWLPVGTIAALISAMMIDFSRQCREHGSDLRVSILALEERMDEDPETVEAEEILDRRAELVTLGAVISDQLPCVQSLSTTDKSFFKLADAKEYMSCALTNLQATDRSLEWLDQRITALRSGFQMHAQEKTNRRLNMLTILSAIFMPITLLAGIWGMNFEIMPELKYPFSYPIALGLMALIGTGMYLYFRRNNWLD